MKRIRILITGKVQGVLFRKSIHDLAKEFGICGFVRNVKDYVEVVLEGEDSKIDKIVEFCKKGPDRAKVDKIKIFNEELKGDKEFNILR